MLHKELQSPVSGCRGFRESSSRNYPSETVRNCLPCPHLTSLEAALHIQGLQDPIILPTALHHPRFPLKTTGKTQRAWKERPGYRQGRGCRMGLGVVPCEGGESRLQKIMCTPPKYSSASAAVYCAIHTHRYLCILIRLCANVHIYIYIYIY